ncbi:unnamed protein product, partial [Hymenolepis diminuta]
MRKFKESKDLSKSLRIPENCDYIDKNRQFGSGAYGDVTLARSPRNNELVVLKSVENQFECILRLSIVRELCALSQFDHQNVLKMLNICCEELIRNGKTYP